MCNLRPDDVFDRIWNLSAWSNEWDTLEAAYEISSLSHSEYKLPMSVMMDAVIPVDISEPWNFSLDLDDDPSQNLYIYMHFAEVQKLREGDIREFTVSLNEDDSWGGGEPVIPNYMVSNTLHHPSAVSGSTTNELSFALKKTNRSTLPPLINAMEVYKIKDFAQSSTKQGDGIFLSYPYISPYNLVIHEQGLKMIQLFPCLFPWKLNTSSRCQEHPVSVPTDKTLARRSMSPLGFPMGWPAVQLQQ